MRPILPTVALGEPTPKSRARRQSLRTCAPGIGVSAIAPSIPPLRLMRCWRPGGSAWTGLWRDRQVHVASGAGKYLSQRFETSLDTS